jgi:uncharacterized protein YbjQ (UPF0145 family)
MNDKTADLIVGLIGLFIQIAVPLTLIAVGYFAGRYAERQHYASIHQREAYFLRLPAVTTKSWDTTRTVLDARLVSGSVVVSADYFKRLLANLRNLIGGRMRSYESLLDRARREAILRLKEQYPDADIIVNLRLETSTIGSRNRQNGISCVELIAYGTAIKYRP